MNAIYSYTAAAGTSPGALKQLWAQSGTGLASGCTSLVPIQIGGKSILFTFNKATQKLDAYVLSAKAPWIRQTRCKADLSKAPGGKTNAWDMINAFVLGNIPYLVAYRADTGQFGYYSISDDLSLSPPYIFSSSHTTPSAGFTTVAPYTSLSGQYLLGYDYNTGRVENFSVAVVPGSTTGAPPLLALNVWFHQWAKYWTHFSFFQLGGSTFFFKINLDPKKPQLVNVNIDHMQDNPAMGGIEIGTNLQTQLPDAALIDAAAIIPWAYGEPYLLTYIASSGKTVVYKIHADCLGWTQETSIVTVKGAALAAPYRIGDTSYVLLYQGSAKKTSQ